MNKLSHKYLPLALAALLIIASVGYFEFKNPRQAQAVGIAFDVATNGGNNGGTTTTLTYNHTVTGSNPILEVCTVGSVVADRISGVTYNGVALTKIGSIQPNTDRWTTLWELVGPATGTHSVVVTSSVSDWIIAQSASYTGASQTGQPDATKTSSSTSTTTLSNTITSIADKSWHIACGNEDSGVPTVGTGTTNRVSGDFNSKIVDNNADITPAGSNTVILNSAGGVNHFIVMIGVTIKPVASAAAAVNAIFFAGD